MKGLTGKTPIALFVFMLGALGFAFEQSTLEKTNAYGGKTLKNTYSEADTYGDQLAYSILYFNEEDEVVLIYSEFTKAKAADFGYKAQLETYEGDIAVEYKMFLSDEAASERGILWQIERVDENDAVYEFEYSDGKNTAKSDGNSFVVEYPFYALPFLEKVFFEDYRENDSGDTYDFSARYYCARSFVKTVGEPEPVSGEDAETVAAYMGTLGKPELSKVYTHKIAVGNGDAVYTCYLQENFQSYLKKGDGILLTYHVFGVNKRLVLLATEFNENER